MPDIRRKLTNPGRAAAGALLQRQSATMNGLLSESEAAYDSARTDGMLSGDIGRNTADKSYMGADAFRHAYSSARATQEFGPEVANLLGRGNEWLAAATRENDNSNQNAADIGMDLHNNRVGREIAKKLGDDASPHAVRDAVLQAANKGDLVLSVKDPRAMKEYSAQHDMKALEGAHDGAVAVASASKAAYQGAVTKVADALESVDGAARTVASRLSGFKQALANAMERDGDSPMFTFTEKQLQAGEKFADKVKPELLSAVEGSVDYGNQMTVSQDRLASLMAPVAQFEEAGMDKESSQETRVAMASKDEQDLSRKEDRSAEREDRGNEREVEREAEREMEVDMC